MKQKFKKIWNIVSTILVTVIVLCAVFLMGSRIIGYRVFNILTGSMSPQYNPGDLIYVKQVSPEEVKIGDPITFVMNEDLDIATHRVVAIDKENSHFYTKGDANDIVDSPVHFKNLIGVPQFSIPKLGYVADFIQNPPGMYITVGIGAVLIIAVFLPDFIRKKKTEDVSAAEDGVKEDEKKEEN